MDRLEMSLRDPSRRGFALVVVIWGIGLIGVLVMAFMSAARWRALSGANIAAAAQADALADGALALAVLEQARHGRRARGQTEDFFDGRPRFCALSNAAVAIAIEDEAGKVDINAAPRELLLALLHGLGIEPNRANRLAADIIAFRSASGASARVEDDAYRAARLPFGPKRALFQTTLELDQVLGIDEALFRDLLPLTTVYSSRPGVDIATAPPALLIAMAGGHPDDVRRLLRRPFSKALDRSNPRLTGPFALPGRSGVLFLHVETRLAGGQNSSRELIVDTRAALLEQFVTKEKRRGASRFADDLETLRADALPAC
jgi:general secretion pathway protein K